MIEYIAGWESRVERHIRKITLISIYLFKLKITFYCINWYITEVLENSPFFQDMYYLILFVMA